MRIESIKATYKPGQKIILDFMDDNFAPPPGTIGEVLFVDDIGQIHVQWENNSSLAVIPKVDKFRKL